MTIEECLKQMGFQFRNLIQHSDGRWSCKLLHSFGGQDEFWGDNAIDALQAASDYLDQFDPE